MQTIDNIKKGLECYVQDRSYMLPCSDCAYHGQGLPHCRKAVHEDALELIERLEARVSVVRCKDCIWWKTPGCTFRIVDKEDEPNEDDFCSYAERMPETHHRPEDCVNYATRTRDGRAVCLGTRELEPCDGAGCKRWKGKVKDE